MDPLLIDVPERIDTPRLVLRCPRAGDGAALNAAVCVSIDELRPWMPWAQAAPTPSESEAWCRRMAARFMLREELTLLILERGADGSEAELVGCCGLHHIDWSVPCFEIGYWRRTGRGGCGFVTEAVQALDRLAFGQLGARRVEIRMDARNVCSVRVAERAGFAFEGVLQSNAVATDGSPRDTRVHARLRGAGPD